MLGAHRLIAWLMLGFALPCSAAPVTTVPEADLDLDGEVEPSDLLCLKRLHQLWALQKPVAADACGVDEGFELELARVPAEPKVRSGGGDRLRGASSG